MNGVRTPTIWPKSRVTVRIASISTGFAMLGIPSEGGGRTFESCRVRHTGSSVEMEAKEKIAPSATDGGADRRTPLRTEPG
jgi:hypothetical protein